MPVAMSTIGGVALLVAAAALVAFAFGMLAYSVRRSWPRIREQGERISREGGPRGVDFDAYFAETIDRLPITGSAPRPSTPRVWVDYNKWGVAGGHGKVFLAAADATDLPHASGRPESLPTYRHALGAADRVTLREGMRLRLMDLDADEDNRPCTLEVDGTVHLDPDRGWYANFNQADMAWVPRQA